MKKFRNIKQLACAAIAAATVISVGCLAMADELGTEDVNEDPAEKVEVDLTEPEGNVEDVIADSADNAEDAAGSGTGQEETDAVDDVTSPENIQDVESEPAQDIVFEVEEDAVTEEASYGVPSGWENKSGKWYYYEDGNPVTGWKQIGKDWYYFYGDGEMVVGRFYAGDFGAAFIFDYRGHMRYGWQKFDDMWFYCESNGKCATGWKYLDGKWYYFNKESSTDPYMYTGPCKIDGKLYMFGEDGSLQNGWVWYEYSWYYANPDGTCVKGWKQIKDKWYYFSEDSGSYPRMYRGCVIKIGSNWYGFNDDGSMITGWYNDYTAEINGMTAYLGDWYYFDKAHGQARKGWQQIGNKWYYFQQEDADDTPYAYRDVRKVEGKYYYFDFETGAMASGGWVQQKYPSYYPYSENKTWYYAADNGVLTVGWKQINGKWYYFGDGSYSPSMHRGLIDIDGDDYYFDANGALVYGWFRETDYEGNVLPYWHYSGKNGVVIYNGWVEIGDKDYYIKNGNMVTGFCWADGMLFEFDSNGVCLNPLAG